MAARASLGGTIGDVLKRAGAKASPLVLRMQDLEAQKRQEETDAEERAADRAYRQNMLDMRQREIEQKTALDALDRATEAEKARAEVEQAALESARADRELDLRERQINAAISERQQKMGSTNWVQKIRDAFAEKEQDYTEAQKAFYQVPGHTVTSYSPDAEGTFRKLETPNPATPFGRPQPTMADLFETDYRPYLEKTESERYADSVAALLRLQPSSGNATPGSGVRRGFFSEAPDRPSLSGPTGAMIDNQRGRAVYGQAWDGLTDVQKRKLAAAGYPEE